MTSLQLSLIFLLPFPLVLSFVSINRDHPEVRWAWLQCLTNTRVDALFIRVARSVQVKRCAATRCVGVSAESSISLLCRVLPASAMWTELKRRHCCSVSCSHARPCQMVLAAGMPAVGFRWIARAQSQPTERKGTIRFTSFCFYCCSDSAQVVVMLFRLYSNGFVCFTCHLIYDNCIINTLATWLWCWRLKFAPAVWLISWPGMSKLLVLLFYIK